MSLEPGKLYTFSEPFRSQLIRVLKASEETKKAKANGTYKPSVQPDSFMERKMASLPPTDKQLGFLKRSGYTGPMPMNRFEASHIISEIKG